MALKVVGTGLGRTGTMSLKLALETLGFGPCHHMIEVFAHPETTALWIEAAEGRPDWERIFEGYAAAVDYPTGAHWRAIAAFYPEAKVIHSVRDPDEWFDSTQATIFAPGSFADNPPPAMAPFFRSFTGPMAGRLHDRAFMTDHFRRHSAEVEAAIPAARRLTLPVGSGWGPLCVFLGVPVPDQAYPSENSREAFRNRIKPRLDAQL
jgi:hypothetical protein